MPLDRTPFAQLKGRTILGGMAVALLLAGIFVGVLSNEHLLGRSQPVMIAAFMVLFYGIYAIFIAVIVRESGLNPADLFGPIPSWSILWRNGLMAVPLQILSVVLTFFSLFFLSYLFPDFVKSWFLDQKLPLVWLSGEGYILASVLSFVAVVILAPIVEEFVFRGLLLTRWTLKWNLQRAILLSSFIFSLGHLEIVGAFVFGYVFSMVYVRTKSLFASIAIHATNNLFAWTIMAVALYADPSSKTSTIEEFQSGWWVMLILGAAVTPWAIKLVRQHREILSLGIPYVPSEAAHSPAKLERQKQVRPLTDGVLVVRVKPGLAGEEAGLMQDDVIVQFDGVRGLTSRRLGQLLATARLQGKVKRIVFVRNGAEHIVMVRPDLLGISAVDVKN